MKMLALRGGHSPNCKGAIGLIDEQEEAAGSRIYNELAPMLECCRSAMI